MSKSKTELPWTMLQRFLMLLSPLLLVGVLLFLLFYLPSVPDTIPTHFDLQGNVDGYGSKYTSLITPIFGLFIYGTMLLIAFFPDAWNTVRPPRPQNRQQVLAYTRTFLCVVTLFICLLFGGMGLNSLGIFHGGLYALLICVAMMVYIILGIVKLNRMTK